MELKPVPRKEWPTGTYDPKRFQVWRNAHFLVQAFSEKDGVVRLSVTLGEYSRSKGKFVDGIQWDDLQSIKTLCGYADRDAIEIYPPGDDVVNVANMRHLWVLPQGERLPMAWRAPKNSLGAIRDLFDKHK